MLSFITHRRSIAERGGCFQWRLFVCQHDNLQTIKRRVMKLGGYVHCTKISPEFECRGQRSTSPGQKMKKSAISCGSCPLDCGPRAAFCSAVAIVIFRQFYAGGKISACCLVVLIPWHKRHSACRTVSAKLPDVVEYLCMTTSYTWELPSHL